MNFVSLLSVHPAFVKAADLKRRNRDCVPIAVENKEQPRATCPVAIVWNLSDKSEFFDLKRSIRQAKKTVSGIAFIYASLYVQALHKSLKAR